MKAQTRSLFIFRRDLRLVDNTGLNAALENSKEVICAFIFDPRQVEKNPYKSDFALQFLIESLEDLALQLEKAGGRLLVFYGIAHEVVSSLIQTQKIDAIYVNCDYTPFSKKRDLAIEEVCKKEGASFHSCADLLLIEPKDISTLQGKPYTIFTPFFNAASKQEVRAPMKIAKGNFFKGSIAFEQKKSDLFKKILPSSKKTPYAGGRNEALTLLKTLGTLTNYGIDRNLPAIKGTTTLSAHHKFGTISIRESYWAIAKALGADHHLIRELYWRDFFTHISFHFPEVFGSEFNKAFRGLRWSQNSAHFKAWCEGKTGFPIVDAGMRELNETGFMHNRVRMIVASFLVKDLHIDWREGEKYFAQKLVDYDPCVNNGNWQWAASTGCDAQPYFRIFNPWLQQEKFDGNCEYIKRWVPELSSLSPKAIHSLYAQRPLGIEEYPKPLVDHAIESKIAKDTYAKASSH